MQGPVYETALKFTLTKAECLDYKSGLTSSVQGKEPNELTDPVNISTY